MLQTARHFITHVLLCVFTLAIGTACGPAEEKATVETPVVSQRDPSAARAREFVERFYKWYAAVPPEERARWEVTTADTSRWVSRELQQLLLRERALALADSGTLSGLEADPFYNAQDPCEAYLPTNSVAQGEEFVIEISPTCSSSAPQPRFQVIVREESAAFVIADVIYPGEFGGSLVARLQRLLGQ